MYKRQGKINLVINTLTQGRNAERDGFKIRRATVEHAIPCLTSVSYTHLDVYKRQDEDCLRSVYLFAP